MRLFPILLAIVVMGLIYALVFQRDGVMALVTEPDTVDTAQEAAPDASSSDTSDLVGVVVVNSVARVLDQAVQLRGQTEADREVELRAETTGQVISEPLRKGAFVEAGQLLCELDPGVRHSRLQEAMAQLAEA